MCAGGGAIYVFLVNGFKDHSVKSLVMALAYCWGLVMAIYLMGHGLVALPRRLFRNANPTRRLRRLQSLAVKLHDNLSDATIELEELEAQLTQLRRRKNAVSRDHEEWIEEISEASSLPDPRRPVATAQTPTLPAVITDRYLGEFSRKLMRARHKRARFVDAWDRLIQEVVNAQAIVDASASKKLEFGTSSLSVTRSGRNLLTPYLRYLLHCKVLPGIRLLSGSLLTFGSICIIWSELVKFIAPRLSIVGLTVLSHPGGNGQVRFVGQLLAALWLLYMSIAALASFDDVKIWGNRALVRRNTYNESATWYSAQIAKLTVPLAYNFITLIPRDVYRDTQFFKFLGALINLTPLGEYFDYIFPMFILVPVLATLFNLYGRIKRVLGFEVLSDEEESSSNSGTGGWRDGQNLIERELQGAARFGLTNVTDETGALSGAQSPQRATHRVDQTAPTSRPAVARQSTFAQRQAQRLAEATAAAEEEDESFFQGFAHRVRNTIDSVERPDWMNDLGKRPKWMGGVGGNGESSGRAEAGRGFGRWFGGRPDDGRIRL